MKYTHTLFIALVLALCIGVVSNASAALQVNVMPSGINGASDSWDSGPYTWPGNVLELWGNVAYDGAQTLTYVWNFGGGEGSVDGTVTDVNNIAVSHAYPNGSFVATLTVTTGDGAETDSDTVEIDVVPMSLTVKTNLAIQKALKYQYLSRVATFFNGVQAYYWNGQDDASVNAALGVLAFENHGHLGKNDPNEDIYAATVMGGLNYLFQHVYCSPASSTPLIPETDSDINDNAFKCYIGWEGLYEQGITSMAIAGSASPSEIVGPAGSPSAQGITYQELLEDLLDYIAYSQADSGTYVGGWRYMPNFEADNSVTQWPVLALGEAERQPWNINAPPFVKVRMALWLDESSQNSNGGFGYTDANGWVNIAKTGAGIAALSYAGLTNELWYGGSKLSKAIDFINDNWGLLGNDGNLGEHYTMYAVKKGMGFADQPLVGTHDWQEEYNQWYVDNQNGNGYWPGSSWIWNAGPTSAAFGLLVMAPLEVCKPVADAGGDQEEAENVAVIFDGSSSTTTCSSNFIVSYGWDCDYDGVTFDLDSSGPTASCTYAITNGADTQNYTAALRVTDDQAKTDIDTVTVTVTNGNLAPVADPGGPYSAAVGADITLDGSASYDINACPINSGPACLGDSIVSYQWDLDGDGLYGSEDSPAEPEGETAVVNFDTFMGTKTIGLKVTDFFGKSAAQSANITTVALSNLYPDSYKLISNVYNRRTRLWTTTWSMYIINVGAGEASLVSAEWTPDSIPVGVTVVDSTVTWTDPDGIIDFGETQISGDANATFSYTYSRYVSPPDLTQITWDIDLTDDLGTRHIIRGILQ